jgi:hypothetical protein
MKLRTARAAFERGDHGQARQILLGILQSEPANEAAWALLMHVARDQDERDKAVERVLRLNPRDAQALAFKAGNAPPLVPGAQNSASLGGGVYEMLWDCPFCGTRKLLGKTHRFCPHCGAGQEADKRYFPAEEEKIAVKDHVYVGADLKCPACQTPNSGNAEFCIQCGAPLSEAARAKRQIDQVRGPGGWQSQEELRQAAQVKQAGSRRTAYIVLAVILLIIGALVTTIFWTQEVSLALSGHAWQREIQIEDFGPRTESAWCESVPGGAYGVSRKSEIRSYKQIPDGETCTTRRADQGDGTFREITDCQPKYRSEPVYGDKCYYQVDRWAYARSLTAEGRDKNPRWPELRLKRIGGACQGCEREGARIEHYTLSLRGEKGSYECEVDQALWQNAQAGSRWRMEVGVVDGGARCNTLEAVK